jgi:DNA-binding MurR/RpiR family transcriptional regulator
MIFFPSYVKANIAKEQNVKIITISDRVLSPIGFISDICLSTEINVTFESLISVASVHNLLNVIMTFDEDRYGLEIKERIKRINETYRK